MAFPILRRVIGLLLKPYLKKINGVENIVKKEGFVIAANHASYMDHLILGAFWAKRLKKPACFLAKKEHFHGIQLLWHKYVNAIPVDREAGGKEALEFAVKALKQGKVIVIYPEGTRTLTGELQKGKTGVARLALGARVPVLPIGIIGTFEILPKGKRIPKNKKAIMNIGKLMYFDKYYGKENDKKVLREVTDNIMDEISKLVSKK